MMKEDDLNYNELTEERNNINSAYCLKSNFFRVKDEFLQKCTHCDSLMFNNNIEKCDKISISDLDFDKTAVYAKYDYNSKNKESKQIYNDIFYKNYREAECLMCKKKFNSNFKTKYYCFWGWCFYKEINNYNDKF